MDYLTILTTRAVAARPTHASAASNWYYHGACLKKGRYATLTNSKSVRFEAWNPGDSVTDNIREDTPLCDECNASLSGRPNP